MLTADAPRPAIVGELLPNPPPLRCQIPPDVAALAAQIRAATHLDQGIRYWLRRRMVRMLAQARGVDGGSLC